MISIITSDKQRWTVAAVGAIGVMGLMIWLMRAPEVASLKLVAPSKPVVRLVEPDGSHTALDEEAIIHDPTPLFLPTARNATLKELPRREPGKGFLDKETLKLGFSEANLNLTKDFPPVVMLGGKLPTQAGPGDLLSIHGPGSLLLGFGQSDMVQSPLPARGGFVEVIASATGRCALAEALPVTARPAVEKAWQPMEFLVAVDAAGLVGPLVVTLGSGVDEVDAYFRRYLGHTFRIGERLSPGFYRIVVGP
ncbi:MAG: hypothetical protein EXS38_01980 [Opitutus sp.]|nr:hypothetical protein [Opitutus sp.]